MNTQLSDQTITNQMHAHAVSTFAKVEELPFILLIASGQMIFMLWAIDPTELSDLMIFLLF